MSDLSLEHQIALLPPEEQQTILDGVDPEILAYDWNYFGRPGQIFDPHDDFAVALALAGRGWGKASSLDTVLPHTLPLTASTGWTKLGDVKVGDIVYDERGRPCNVTGVFDRFPDKAYRVHFSDGTHIDACDEHQWVTWTHQERKQYLRHNPGVTDFPEDWVSYQQPLYQALTSEGRRETGRTVGPTVRTTQQLLDTLRQNTARRDLNHCIPLARALQTPDVPLLVEPWLLGYWLGNGVSTTGGIAGHLSDEPEVRVRLRYAGFLAGTLRANPLDRQVFGFTVLRLVPLLRDLGVLGNKHVPDEYLWAGEQHRRALLAGLMDSDGYCDPVSGQVEFVSMTRSLADAVVHLARSLGEKPVLGAGRATLYGTDHGEKYRVTWRPNINPFMLSRKGSQVRPLGSQALRNRHRMITAIEPIEPSPMRCLSVDSPNHMYLIGEGMIPTHNSLSGAQWIRSLDTEWHTLGRDTEHLRFALLGRTAGDVRDVMLEGPSGLLNVWPPSQRHRVVWTPSRRRVELPNGAVGLCFSAEEPDQLRGPAFHCFPEGTLVRTSSGPMPIELVRVGQMVWTRQGLRPVMAASSSEAPVATLHHEWGTLTGTLDHPVLTHRGWVQLALVRPTDRLIGWANGSGRSTTVGGLTGDGKTTQLSGVPMSCGRQSTVQYLQDTRSITSISTASTMTRPTSSRSRPRTTRPYTGPRSSLALAHDAVPSSTSMHLGATQSTASRAEWRWIERSSEQATRSDPRTSSCVSTAASSSAPDVESIAVNGVSISGHVTRVHNLMVQDVPEFFADDVLVHNCGWADELASYKQMRTDDAQNATAWENLRIAVRQGTTPQILATTTPKRVPVLRQLLKEAGEPGSKILVRRGRTLDNVKLSKAYLDVLFGLYGGTRLGAQELEGEMLDDVVGAMTTEAIIEKYRRTSLPAGIPWLRVIGVDPSVAERPHDECGMVVVYATRTWPVLRRHAFVVDDFSMQASPAEWSDRLVQEAYKHKAVIVAEVNQGANLVKHLIHQAADKRGLPTPPVREVWASKSKSVRSETIGAAYSRGRIHHLNVLPEYETQATSWVHGEAGYSPDRMDAGVHALASVLFSDALIHGSPGSAAIHSAADQRLPDHRLATGRSRAG